MPDDGAFGESYWTADSQYRKFKDYAAAQEALTKWHAGFWRLVARYMPPGGRHVDAGCGYGVVVHDLLARGWDSHGFDISEWVVAQAGADAPGRFAVGTLTDFPFPGSFDLITCLEVLEHVADPVEALAALGQRLNPRGRLIATTPNLKPRIPWPDTVAADPTHISVHEPEWWRQAVSAAGLSLVAISTFMALPFFWRYHGAFARWIRLGPSIGPGTLIVAER